jgi:chromosome segregation protein
MKLEKIILDGFKSFADRTELDFNSQITSIVGPNGCGKSNVVDAVKWVLGEQSTKSLRSDQMADVIFGGSSSRKPLSTAEVSIIFSNTAGKLPIDATQVQISRRIFRTGESEYRINNKPCRLKDIRELLMDTGVGVKAYSIIEQGQVDHLLTSSKVDRRSIFEEAAGISKFKAHKKETLRRLEQTEQNLLRLADILNEIAKQLRSVKLQAGKARSYLKYTERLKELQLNYSLAEYHKVHTESAQKQKELNSIEEQFAASASQLAQKDSHFSNLGEQIINTENQINQADNALVSVQSKIEQQMQRIEFLSARIKELQERKDSAQQRIQKLDEQKKSLSSGILLHQTELAECDKKFSQSRSAENTLQQMIQQLNSDCDSFQADLDDEKSGIIDTVRLTAQLHNELQSLSLYRNNLANQKNHLAGRAETSRSELEKLLAEKAQHKARIDDTEKLLSDLEQNLESKRNEIEQTAAKISVSSKNLSQSKETRSSLTGELAVLSDMEQKLEGVRPAIKSILSEKSSGRFDYVDGLLADIVSADMQYAAAVEAALEGKTDTLIISDSKNILADIQSIEKLDSRAHFLSGDTIQPFANSDNLSGLSGVKGRLAEFVKFDYKFAPFIWHLLGKTLLVDSIESAACLSRQLSAGYSFVTLNGQFLSSDGTLKLGPLGKAAGLISRKSRLRQLEETIAGISAEITQLENQIDSSNNSLEHSNKLLKDLRTAVYETNTEKMQLNSKLAILEQGIKKLRDEEPLIAGEIDLLEEQITESVQKEYQSKQKLTELEEVNRQRTSHIQLLENGLAQKKSEQLNLANQLTDLKVSIGQICEQTKGIKQTLAGLQNQLAENTASSHTAQNEIQTCSEQSQKATGEILNAEMLVSEMFVEKEKSQQASRLLHDQVNALLEEQKLTEQFIRQKKTEHTQLEQNINNLKIELGQFSVMRQNLIDKAHEQLQIDLSKSYENYSDSSIDWELVRTEMTDLRQKIERLGNVNVDSIQEQDDLEKRNDFLSTQVADLNNSKDQLQQLISRLNKQSREKFRECFEQIRTNFQMLFRKLFGGGKADILLEDSEDILEAGIEIVAQPPGKETRSISLLSGGEKSMTAIALLFSVFKTKPSPFCFLDEVDAALDEANNERFNLIIKEFQKESQFVVITHSKRTMSIAEILYGITMQTRGVSKKISVKFDEYEPEKEPREAAAVA